MHKYIRTKDKIIKNPYLKEENGIQVFELTADNMFLKKDDIVKTSSNLEELCDAFYVDTNYCYADNFGLFAKELWRLPTLNTMIQETQKQLYKDFPNSDDVDKYLSQKVTYTLYGMVKTDKGFTYIAKLHKDGEWELL